MNSIIVEFWMLLSLTESLFFVCNIIMFYLVCTTYISCYERILYSYDQNICNRKEWNSGILFHSFSLKGCWNTHQIAKMVVFFLLLYWHLGALFFSYFFENPLGLEGIIPKSFIESSLLSSTNHGFFRLR